MTETPASNGLVIEVLVSEGCPHAQPAMELAQRVAARLAPAAAIISTEVNTLEEANARGFVGSPSLRVNGEDVEGRVSTEGMLACRVYEGGSGIPQEWMVEAAILRALQPKGLLFLCVANSARSQMAEGIARALAPQGTKVFSAGSRPTGVRPEAVEVLAEIGIDIASQRSKAVTEIPASEVDTVITLCNEEECPVFLGKARRLHWGLPDPAAKTDSKERLEAFRQVRDELLRRLRCVFRGSPCLQEV